MSISKEKLIRVLIGQKTKVTAYILYLVGDNEIAEDIFQDISVVAYQKSDSIKNENHLMSWLRVAARNECLKTIRTQARSFIRFDSETIELLEPHWQQFDHQDSKLQDKLRECLDQLSDKAKEIVKLRYYEDLKSDAISKTLNMKLNTVYVALSRIHRWLAECVQIKYSQNNY